MMAARVRASRGGEPHSPVDAGPDRAARGAAGGAALALAGLVEHRVDRQLAVLAPLASRQVLCSQRWHETNSTGVPSVRVIASWVTRSLPQAAQASSVRGAVLGQRAERDGQRRGS